MNKKTIEKVLLEISTPTGLTYSGDATICNDEVKDIMNYINNLEQQCKKQKEVIDRANKYLHTRGIQQYYNGRHYRGLDGLQVQVLEDILKEVSE